MHSAPITTGAPSAATTAPNATCVPGPITTSPQTIAVGATCAVASIRGRLPSCSINMRDSSWCKLRPSSSCFLHDLIAHKGFADAALLSAIEQHPAASTDGQLRTLLHHILVSNRFWLFSILGEPFNAEIETQVPDTFDALAASFRTTHARETTWLANVTDDA